MRSGKQITIIKHQDRNNSRTVVPDNGPANVQRVSKNAKRDAVSVVTEWVSELRRRKSEERKGFDSLFDKAA